MVYNIIIVDPFYTAAAAAVLSVIFLIRDIWLYGTNKQNTMGLVFFNPSDWPSFKPLKRVIILIGHALQFFLKGVFIILAIFMIETVIRQLIGVVIWASLWYNLPFLVISFIVALKILFRYLKQMTLIQFCCYSVIVIIFELYLWVLLPMNLVFSSITGPNPQRLTKIIPNLLIFAFGMTCIDIVITKLVLDKQKRYPQYLWNKNPTKLNNWFQSISFDFVFSVFGLLAFALHFLGYSIFFWV